MNFLKDLFDNAFENDKSLSSKDRKKGQLEPINDRSGSYPVEAIMTETQKAWRQRQQGAALMSNDMLVDTTFALDLYLAGVPDKDPSNDLYGSRTNISTRDRASGLDLPPNPTLESLRIRFLPNNVCQVLDQTPFTTGPAVEGEWKLNPDGTMLRFSMDVLGYNRKVQTKGSIENVFWTDEPSKQVKTSTSYSIPPGWIYADVPVSTGIRPGLIQFKEMGVLRIEQSMGLLGAGSRMVACGSFEGTQIFDDTIDSVQARVTVTTEESTDTNQMNEE